jgi:tetratricopeptide (TPR) repeat protein
VKRRVAMAAALAASWLVAAPNQAAAAPPRVFVMPFEVDAPTVRTFWVGEGAAILVADELDALGTDAIGRSERVAAFEDMHLPVTGTLTRATMIRVAETSDAADVVLGRVLMDDRRLTLTARVLRLDSGGYLPDIVEQGAPQDLFALSRKVAQRAFTELTGQPAAASQAPRDTPALEAFEPYVKGLLDERPDARLRLFRAALARQPDFDRVWLAIWEVHAETGDHQAALAAAKSVPASSPRSRRARFFAGRSQIELRAYDDAFATFKALADERPSAAALNNLGVVQVRRGATPHTGRATYYFNKAVEADGDAANVAFNLGYAYMLEHDPRAATYWLREAVRRSPLDADAHLVLAAALTATGAGVEAGRERELAGRLAARYEDWEKRGHAPDQVPRGLERVAEHEQRSSGPRFDQAITAAAQRDSRELASYYLERGRRLFEQQKDADASVELRRALYLSPYDADAHLLLGRTLLRSGRASEAVSALRMSVWSQDSVAGRFALAEALMETKEPGLARAEAMRALLIDPSFEPARTLIARIDQGPPK